MSLIVKQLNVETWPLDYVIEWLKGISPYSENYVKSFEAKKLNGKKLAILELSDLNEIMAGQNANLNHQLTIFKSIQNLVQMRHDLNKETLQTLIFTTHTRIVSIINFINRLEQCACIVNDCERCMKFKRSDILSASTALAQVYRRLISWLVRIPFTRLKPFEDFREEINNEMKKFLRYFRKRSAEAYFRDMKLMLKSMQECCVKMLEYCDQHCTEKENGKIAVAYSCCYLEKVVIKRKSPEQILGLKLTTLSDGIFTVAEIVRESAADECSHLNVEDDIIAVNNQIVVGWSSANIIKLLETSFENNTVWLVLRKMPKDHLNSIKQQKNLVFIYKNQNVSKDERPSSGTHQRKHSISDIFDLSDEFIMEDSSDEDEEDYADFNRNNADSTDVLDSKETIERKFSIGGFFYEKNRVNEKNLNKTKLNKKSNKSRLIRSMQNLLSFDRSRSNSTEKSISTNDESEPKSSRRKSNSFVISTINYNV